LTLDGNVKRRDIRGTAAPEGMGSMVRLEALRGSNVYITDGRFVGDVTDFFQEEKNSSN
jgi:hypothetical protein